EHGRGGFELLGDLKAVLDPRGIMNPSKLGLTTPRPMTTDSAGSVPGPASAQVLELDTSSLTVRAGAAIGINLLEEATRARGLTLGPRAQRVATRRLADVLADDPARTGLDRQVIALKAQTGDGRLIEVRPAPRRATGPDPVAPLLGLRGRGV